MHEIGKKMVRRQRSGPERFLSCTTRSAKVHCSMRGLQSRQRRDWAAPALRPRSQITRHIRNGVELAPPGQRDYYDFNYQARAV
jgi:hypothetical protein